MVRTAVLKGKDPFKILEEMEIIDKMGKILLKYCCKMRLLCLLNILKCYKILKCLL